MHNVHIPKNSPQPTEGMGISWGEGAAVRPKNLKTCMKPNWNFQRGGGMPSMGYVWMFSVMTQCIAP